MSGPEAISFTSPLAGEVARRSVAGEGDIIFAAQRPLARLAAGLLAALSHPVRGKEQVASEES